MTKRGSATYVVNTSDEFDRWWAACSEALQDAIAAHVGLLERIGPQLGCPYADTLGGSTISNLEEFRVQHHGRAYRILYAFDVRRDAFDVRRETLLLLAGIKSDEKRWYRRAIRRAETIWERHLEPLEEHDG